MIERLVDAALEATIVGSYSSIGYAVRSRLEHWHRPERADGRVALVTGATSGIGRATAHALAGLGATVCLVGRDVTRGEQTVGDIVADTGNANVYFTPADLSDLAAVRTLAARIAQEHERLDVVVHNAGALTRDYHRTEDGLELTTAVHVVAPFLLTHALIGQLRRADTPRVVTMSSGGMYTQRLDVAALDPAPDAYDAVKAYARAKRAQVELTRLWEQRYGRSGIRFVTTHPGWVATPGVETSLPVFSHVMRPILRTAAEGADTAVWLATSPGSRLAAGRFWHDRRPRAEHRVPWTHAPPGEAARLWDWCATRAGVEAPRPTEPGTAAARTR